MKVLVSPLMAESQLPQERGSDAVSQYFGLERAPAGIYHSTHIC